MPGQTKKLLLGVIAGIICLGGLLAGVALISDKPKADQGTDLRACEDDYPDVRTQVQCVSSVVTRRLRQDPNPAKILPEVDRQVDAMSIDQQDNCHVAMHLVGSQFAKERKVTLATMQQYLPASDSTNCSAGFTHGMISVMGVNPIKAREMAEGVCQKEPTRSRQFACIHGVGHGLRRYLGDPSEALKFCRTLRSESAASDCGQGVYHDLFLAAPAAKNLKRPLKDKAVTMGDLLGSAKPRNKSTALDRLCLDQPKDFLRECWYRLAAGPGIPLPVERAREVSYACGGLPGYQRKACITGLAISRITPDKLVPACAPLDKQSEVEACVDGINLISVGWTPPDEKSPQQYRRENVPIILSQCQSLIRSAKVRRNCIVRTAQFSFRTVSVGVTPAEARSICRNLEQQAQQICVQTVDKTYRDTFRIKV